MGYGFTSSPIFTEVAAGVAILLFGMMMLEKGFNTFVSGPLHQWLNHLTDKNYKSLGLGFIVTALLQSSSLITVITISFISAGLLNLKAGIGVVFGSNLGTTATAWMVAVFGLKINVAALSMPMIGFGVVMVLQNNKNWQGIGNVLAGLGFFFLGIHFMKNGFDSYQDSIDLAAFALPGILGMIVYTVIGVLITLVLQSSSAAMALILTALAAGQITYPNALALAIGSNVGTTITAILGALSSNVAGKRLAGAHFVFNILTAVVALSLIVPLEKLVDLSANWFGLAADNFVMKLSIFHTIFNLLGLIIMLPMMNMLIKLLTHFFKEEQDVQIERPKYLNPTVLTQAQAGIEAIIKESRRLFEKGAYQIVAYGLNFSPNLVSGEKNPSNSNAINELSRNDFDDIYYKKIKTIYSEILNYASKIEYENDLSERDINRVTHVKLANRKIIDIIQNIERIRKNISTYSGAQDPVMKQEYDSMRFMVLDVLRKMYELSVSNEPSSFLNELLELKQIALSSDKLVNGSIQLLINEGKLDGFKAASLANDSQTIIQLAVNLIETVELLYIGVDPLADPTEVNNSEPDKIRNSH